MSAHRTERLLNLVICLLSTRRWLTKEQIRVAVPQYQDCGSTEAFDRMFERDKEDLREMGIPLATGTDDAWFDDELGYRVDRDAYALPELSFEPDELAVLGLASRVWQQASLAGPAARALVKLRAAGAGDDDGSLIGLEPRVRTIEPAFDPLYRAVRDAHPVTFEYRTARTDGTARRRVDPWGLTSWRGRWYLIGHDHDRDAPRVFRLSRIDGGVTVHDTAATHPAPDDLDLRALVSGAVGPEPTSATALVRLRGGAGQALRRRGELTGDGSADWVDLRVAFGDAGILADELAALAPDVEVLDPPHLREAVVARWRGAVLVHSAARVDSDAGVSTGATS